MHGSDTLYSFDFSFFDFRFFDFSFLILVSLFLLYNISIVKTKTNVKSILANAKYLSQNMLIRQKTHSLACYSKNAQKTLLNFVK